MAIDFEWDEAKAAANRRAHKVSFEEASTAFGDEESITIGDPDHSRDEELFVLIGRSHADRILVVVHPEQGDRIRIISARRATASEIAKYEQGQEEAERAHARGVRFPRGRASQVRSPVRARH